MIQTPSVHLDVRHGYSLKKGPDESTELSPLEPLVAMFMITWTKTRKRQLLGNTRVVDLALNQSQTLETNI